MQAEVLDLVTRCKWRMAHPAQLVFPSIEGEKRATESQKQRAARISALATRALEWMGWTEDSLPGPLHKQWRELSLSILQLSIAKRLEAVLVDDTVGLTPDRMEFVAASTQAVSELMHDYVGNPRRFRALETELRRKEAHSFLQELLAYFIPRMQAGDGTLETFSRHTVAYVAERLLTPRVLTQLILSIKFPRQVEEDDGDEWEEFRQFKQKQPELCERLGDAVLDCVAPHLSKTVRTLVLKPLRALVNRSLGAFIYASLQVIITSDSSRLLPILEGLLEEGEQEEERVSDAELKGRLESAIDRDLKPVVRFLIAEDPSERKWIKGKVDGLIDKLKPALVDLVWDEEAAVTEQLLCRYLSPVFKQWMTKWPQREAPPVALPTPQSLRLAATARKGIEDYVWMDQTHYRSVCMEVLETIIQRITSAPQEDLSAEDVDARVLHAGEIISLCHLFLDDYRKADYKVKFPTELPEQPLLDFIDEVIRGLYPESPELRYAAQRLGKDFAAVLLDTLGDPVTLSNFLLSFSFPDGLEEREAEKQEGQLPGKETHGPFGKSIIRLTRSLLQFSGKFDRKQSMVVGFFNFYHRKVGRAILEAKGPPPLAYLRHALWKASGDKRLEIDWEERPEQLKERVEQWFCTGLGGYIDLHIDKELPWGLKGYSKNQVQRLLRGFAQRLNEMIWDEDRAPLKLLLFHYLLPAFRPVIARALLETLR